MAQTYHNYVTVTGDIDARRKLSAKLLAEPPSNWEWVCIALENSLSDKKKETMWEFYSRNSPKDIEDIMVNNPQLSFACRFLDLSGETIYSGSFANGASNLDWEDKAIEWLDVGDAADDGVSHPDSENIDLLDPDDATDDGAGAAPC